MKSGRSWTRSPTTCCSARMPARGWACSRSRRPPSFSKPAKTIGHVYIDPKIKDYIVQIVTATRNPAQVGLGDLTDMIAHGASPRASIALNVASRAHAFMKHRGYVTPEDIKAIGPDVLRHRIIRSYEAEAEEITSDQIVRRIFETVEVP